MFNLNKGNSVILSDAFDDPYIEVLLEIWNRFGDDVYSKSIEDNIPISWDGRDYNRVPCFPGEYIWRITTGGEIKGGFVFVAKY